MITCFLVAGLLAVLLYELPGFIRGENSAIAVHDCFDHHFSYLSLLDRDWGEHKSDEVPFLLGGTPSVAFCLEVKAVRMLCRLLPAYWAYRINDAFLRIAAYLGTYLFLLGFRDREPFPAWGVALAAALLPYWGPGCLTVAGIPLLAFAARSLVLGSATRRGAAGAMLVFALYPFFSMLTHSGAYFIAGLSALAAFRAVTRRKIPYLLLAAIALMTCGYLVANWRFIENTLGPNPIVWQREEWRTSSGASLREGFRQLVNLILNTQMHADANPYPWTWTAALASLLLPAGQWISRRAGVLRPGLLRASAKRLAFPILYCLGAILAIAVLTFFWYEPWILNLRETLLGRFSLLRSHNLRLYFFYPLLFPLMLYCSLAPLWTANRFAKLVVVALLLGQITSNVRRLPPFAGEPTFSQFRSADLFNRAARLLNAPRSSCRIACLGFYPAIANLNGFQTVDGYWYLYPLAYKHRFRPVIAGELAKSETIRDYFDRWGSRCYILSAELGLNFYVTKSSAVKSVKHLRLDTVALRALGATHLFSAVLIENYGDMSLRYLGACRDERSPCDLHIYEVPPAP